MIASLRAEIMKLFTVQSTYILLVFGIFVVAIAAYVQGLSSDKYDFSTYIVNSFVGWASLMAVFWGIVAGLHMTYEFRYGTIAFTTVFARRRGQVLLSKIIVYLLFSSLATILALFIGALALYIGTVAAGHHPLDQDYSLAFSPVWRCLVYCGLFTLTSLALGVLLRQAVAVLTVILLVPSALEPLLGVVLRDKEVYLPFTALGQLLQVTGPVLQSIGIFAIYFVVLWLCAWTVFLQRDVIE